MGHLLRYGELTIRRSVPLALALLSPSNPKLNILDTLSKFSHDRFGENLAATMTIRIDAEL